jgi:S-(hydroxymethyl)glutathione dehydrogenase/alcohol dehydrogenase
VTSLTLGDHVVTLFSPQCHECIHCLSYTNLCLAIREQQSKGFLPLPARYRDPFNLVFELRV